jgi:hypothetical protein
MEARVVTGVRRAVALVLCGCLLSSCVTPPISSPYRTLDVRMTRPDAGDRMIRRFEESFYRHTYFWLYVPENQEELADILAHHVDRRSGQYVCDLEVDSYCEFGWYLVSWLTFGLVYIRTFNVHGDVYLPAHLAAQPAAARGLP